jgi:hypothetical protein
MCPQTKIEFFFMAGFIFNDLVKVHKILIPNFNSVQ